MTHTAINEVSRRIPPEIREGYGDTALFTAYGCALIEKETGTGYTYRALNLKTGQSKVVHRRKNPLTTSGVAMIAEKIRICSVTGKGSFEIDMPPGENLLRDKLFEIQRHVFESILPQYGYGLREKQIELSNHILNSIGNRAISLCEAETGTGKTHAYLLAAALAKRSRINDFWLRGYYTNQSYAESAHMPFVISTSSIALQKAIVRDYIPEISRMLLENGIITTPLSCVIRKGRRHYVCEKNLQAYYADADAQTKLLLEPLLSENGTIDLGDADWLSEYVKRRIGVTGRCGKECPYFETCRYLRHMEYVQSNEHDFQICNHNYFLADILRRSNNDSPLIPHYQGVIIDEAHKFLDAARQMYGIQLPSTSIQQTVDDIRSITYKRCVSDADIRKLADKLGNQNTRLFEELHNSMIIPETDADEAERFKVTIGTGVARNFQNISSISLELASALAEKEVRDKYKGLRAQTMWQLSRIRQMAEQFAKPDGLIYWIEQSREFGNGEQEIPCEALLCATPKNLNELLYRDLWNKRIPIVLTSGTLSAAGNFAAIRRKTGLDRSLRLSETSKPSPFDYQKNALIYISEGTTFPDIKNKCYIRSIADETERLIKAAHGHAAVLFTSYKAMDMVYNLLVRRNIGFPLIRLDRGGVNAIEQFKASGNGVLFASGALWEGIDIPGDALSLLIIVKLPFQVPDPVSEYEQTLYDNMDEYKSAVIVPEMLIKLKQGFGRLIRTETDTGAVALLDSRMRVDGAYRNRALSALPDCRVTDSVEDAEAFFRAKKDEGYFI